MPKGPSPEKQVAMTVQDVAEAGLAAEAPLVFWLARVADEVPGYWSKARDVYLAKFWQTEPLLAGAVYSMCAKVAALDFRLIGAPKSRNRFREVLLSADFGSGWVHFVSRVVQDLLTQDNGAFIELLRPENATSNSPVYGISHMDSQKCERTGVPAKPVKYRKRAGTHASRELNWWEVIALSDLPSPRDELKGVGFCAVSRVLDAARVLRDIGIYKRQKLAGKRIPALIFASGIRRNAIKAALDEALEEQTAKGETLYTSPVILASPDPSREIDAKLIELAGLPDNYDEDTSLKWYIAQLAIGFGTDYTEFAPLPGGGLGTATQSTEMGARARGKGPGVVLQQIEFAINWFILPSSLTFQFASTDPMAERERVSLRHLRARERALRIQSGELSKEQALRLAVEEGDAPPSFLTSEEESDRYEVVVKELQSIQMAWERAERLLATPSTTYKLIEAHAEPRVEANPAERVDNEVGQT